MNTLLLSTILILCAGCGAVSAHYNTKGIRPLPLFDPIDGHVNALTLTICTTGPNEPSDEGNYDEGCYEMSDYYTYPEFAHRPIPTEDMHIIIGGMNDVGFPDQFTYRHFDAEYAAGWGDTSDGLEPIHPNVNAFNQGVYR